jgi:hypothetical protein
MPPKRSRLLPVRECVVASLSAGTNAYMRALTLVNLLKPVLDVSRCYLPYFFIFVILFAYMTIIIQICKTKLFFYGQLER